MISAQGVAKTISFIYLITLLLSPLNRPPPLPTREKIGDDSDPPSKVGGHAAPRRRAMWHALPGLPGGRYRRYLSLREGSEQPPEAALKEGTQTYEMAVAPVGKNPLSPRLA